MLKDNKINKVKLFDSDHWTVHQFAGTGIEVMLGIPNLNLKKFSKDYDAVQDYVKENVSDHLRDHGGVKIKYKSLLCNYIYVYMSALMYNMIKVYRMNN